MMTNFTVDSWKIMNDAQHGLRKIQEEEWTQIFRFHFHLIGSNDNGGILFTITTEVSFLLRKNDLIIKRTIFSEITK